MNPSQLQIIADAQAKQLASLKRIMESQERTIDIQQKMIETLNEKIEILTQQITVQQTLLKRLDPEFGAKLDAISSSHDDPKQTVATS